MRHFLSLTDLSKDEIMALYETADKIKKDRAVLGPLLKGKTIGLLFEKPSLRTRLSFEVGVNNLMGRPLYLSQQEVQLGKREAISDVARIMSGYLDGLVIRTFAHEGLRELAKFASIPVISGLCDSYHPAQVLSDFYTILRKKGSLKGLKIVYVGDGNNVCHSIMHAVALLGGTLVISCPHGYEPSQDVYDCCEKMHDPKVSQILFEPDPRTAMIDADVVYTDVWTSMGKEAENEVRKKVFADHQINSLYYSYAKRDCLIMHCLPAHCGEEITREMMEHKNSVVFEQAENRLYVQQALMAMIFGQK
jgi:ornithine carbamoyltransferase